MLPVHFLEYHKAMANEQPTYLQQWKASDRPYRCRGNMFTQSVWDSFDWFFNDINRQLVKQVQGVGPFAPEYVYPLSENEYALISQWWEYPLEWPP